jgi:hypothetical protein
MERTSPGICRSEQRIDRPGGVRHGCVRSVRQRLRHGVRGARAGCSSRLRQLRVRHSPHGAGVRALRVQDHRAWCAAWRPVLLLRTLRVQCRGPRRGAGRPGVAPSGPGRRCQTRRSSWAFSPRRSTSTTSAVGGLAATAPRCPCPGTGLEDPLSLTPSPRRRGRRRAMPPAPHSLSLSGVGCGRRSGRRFGGTVSLIFPPGVEVAAIYLIPPGAKAHLWRRRSRWPSRER